MSDIKLIGIIILCATASLVIYSLLFLKFVDWCLEKDIDGAWLPIIYLLGMVLFVGIGLILF